MSTPTSGTPARANSNNTANNRRRRPRTDRPVDGGRNDGGRNDGGRVDDRAAAPSIATHAPTTPATPAVLHDTDFVSLGVPAALIAAMDKLGVLSAFPIQSATLPDSLHWAVTDDFGQALARGTAPGGRIWRPPLAGLPPGSYALRLQQGLATATQPLRIVGRPPGSGPDEEWRKPAPLPATE